MTVDYRRFPATLLNDTKKKRTVPQFNFTPNVQVLRMNVNLFLQRDLTSRHRTDLLAPNMTRTRDNSLKSLKMKALSSYLPEKLLYISAGCLKNKLLVKTVEVSGRQTALIVFFCYQITAQTTKSAQK